MARNTIETRRAAVLRLKTEGLTHSAIATQLGVHPSTIQDDVSILRSRERTAPEASPEAAPTPHKVRTPERRPDDASVAVDWSLFQPCDVAWSQTPAQPGLYRWVLSGTLPEGFDWADHLEPINQGDLIYVGKAKQLRTRAKHHRLRTPGSTLRRALAALIGLQPMRRTRGKHPGLSDEDEARLSEWMYKNLEMSFRVLSTEESPLEAEGLLRRTSRAPLNRDGLTPEQQYVSRTGKAWLATTIDLRM